MRPRVFLTVLITKFLVRILRLFRLGGTTLPGKIAKKIYPNILKEISTELTIIMVTGTNGKTTTTKIVSKIFDNCNIKYFTNVSGANLVSGITTTLINHMNLNGKFNYTHALIEIDEAAFGQITHELIPQYLVVTNFFRDQLDRYGELYSTLKSVQEGIQKSSDIKLIINADDSLSSSILKNVKNQSITYGFSAKNNLNTEDNKNADANYCIFCKEKYTYDFSTYAHLGGFKCTNCGYSHEMPLISCEEVISTNDSTSEINIKIEDTNFENIKINLPGIYNIYNSLAAVSLSKYMNLSFDEVSKSLASFESGFGRMETITFDNKSIKLILVKNPAGFNQVLSYLLTSKKTSQIAFIINDNVADGTDISWLWDVNFELLTKMDESIKKLYTSGMRAEDMAIRLKYSGIETSKIEVEKDYNILINKLIENSNSDESIYILPTYTAMLSIRKQLSKKFKLKEFWK